MYTCVRGNMVRCVFNVCSLLALALNDALLTLVFTRRTSSPAYDFSSRPWMEIPTTPRPRRSEFSLLSMPTWSFSSQRQSFFSRTFSRTPELRLLSESSSSFLFSASFVSERIKRRVVRGILRSTQRRRTSRRSRAGSRSLLSTSLDSLPLLVCVRVAVRPLVFFLF